MDMVFLAVLLVAISVALVVWSLGSAVGDVVSNERKKVQQRLFGENQSNAIMPEFARTIRREVELTGWSASLVKLPGMASLHHAMEQTWPESNLAKFVAISGALGLGSFVIVGAVFGALLLAVPAGLLGGALPVMFLKNRRGSRQNQLANQLPEALDFLSRVLRAGHSLSTGLQMVSEELPEPLAGEFRRVYNSHSLGRSLDDALKEAAIRIGSADFGFFVTAVLIQRQTGGDLSEVLDNISGMIRGRIRLVQSVKAKTAEGRFTGYILTAFPVALFFLTYALNPTYASVLLSGTGLYVLGAAATMCILGLICIRKITTVRV